MEKTMSAVVALCSYIRPGDVERVIASWKMSREQADQLRWTMPNRDAALTVDELKGAISYGISKQWVLELLELQRRYDDHAVVREWTPPVFPVTGNDLLVAGVNPGPGMGNILKAMKSYWVAHNYEPGKNFFLETLDMFDDE